MVSRFILFLMVGLTCLSLYPATSSSSSSSSSSQPSSSSSVSSSSSSLPPRGSVRSLQEMAAEKAAGLLDPVVVKNIADELIKIWTSEVNEPFLTLWERSKKALTGVSFKLRAEFSSMYSQGFPTDIVKILYAPIMKELLSNLRIGEKIVEAPLFKVLARWPKSGYCYLGKERIRITQPGDVIKDTGKEIYIRNHTSDVDIMKIEYDPSVPTTWLDINYDGSAIIRNVKENGFFIYDVDSGELLYSDKSSKYDVKTSPYAPLVMYRKDRTDDSEGVLFDIIVYNYRTKELRAYPISDPLMDSYYFISPLGTYIAFNNFNFDPKNIYNSDRAVVVVDLQTQRRSIIKKYTWHASDPTLLLTESMLIVQERSGRGGVNIHRVADLKPHATEQELYARLPYAKTLFGLACNNDERRLLVTAEHDVYIYDLPTRKIVSTFKGWADVGNAAFMPLHDNVIRLSGHSSISFYLHDREKLVSVYQGPPSRAVGKCDTYNFRTNGSAIAYYNTPTRSYLSTLNLLTQVGSLIRREKYHDEIQEDWRYDAAGNLICADLDTIEQLVIDPTNCTPDQLFFLLYFTRAARADDRQKIQIYRDLLRSPILVTFPAKAIEHLTRHIEELIKDTHERLGIAPAAPESFAREKEHIESLHSLERKLQEKTIRERREKLKQALYGALRVIDAEQIGKILREHTDEELTGLDGDQTILEKASGMVSKILALLTARAHQIEVRSAEIDKKT